MQSFLPIVMIRRSPRFKKELSDVGWPVDDASQLDREGRPAQALQCLFGLRSIRVKFNSFMTGGPLINILNATLLGLFKSCVNLSCMTVTCLSPPMVDNGLLVFFYATHKVCSTFICLCVLYFRFACK